MPARRPNPQIQAPPYKDVWPETKLRFDNGKLVMDISVFFTDRATRHCVSTTVSLHQLMDTEVETRRAAAAELARRRLGEKED